MQEEQKDLTSQGLGEDPQVNLGESMESFFQRLWQRVKFTGLENFSIRLGTVLLTGLLLAGTAYILGRYYVSIGGRSALGLGADPAFQVNLGGTPIAPPLIVGMQEESMAGIHRDARLQTIKPSMGRTEIIDYVIEQNDTLFTIAEKFTLRPETILSGNRYTIGGDPHLIFPGQSLQILPVDGTLHRWSQGEGLNGVAEYYHVSPDAIVDYPGNHLDRATLGSFSNPNIPTGTLLIIPGGYGEYPDWRTPRINRAEPAQAVNLGPGACTEAYDGIVGTQNFIWPVGSHYLVGYGFDPGANHFALDLAGAQGEPVIAADSGVVVYAGWSDWGYGNMVVLDHGSGWQTLYAHLSVIAVSCGQEVYQGAEIGLVGDTGNASVPQLHFEMRSDEFGRVNPWDFLN